MTVVNFKMVIAEINCFEFAIEWLTLSQTVIFPKILEAIFVVEMLTLKSAVMTCSISLSRLCNKGTLYERINCAQALLVQCRTRTRNLLIREPQRRPLGWPIITTYFNTIDMLRNLKKNRRYLLITQRGHRYRTKCTLYVWILSLTRCGALKDSVIIAHWTVSLHIMQWISTLF